MGPIRRGTVAVAVVVAFLVGAALATAFGNRGGGARELVVPASWRAAWDHAHVLEGEDVALAWGDRAGTDPLTAPDGLRFDPQVVLAQLEALHALDTDVLGLGATEGPLAARKLVAVVDGTWSTGPGAGADPAVPVGGGVEAGRQAPGVVGDLVDGVAVVRVDPAVLAPSLEAVTPATPTADPSPTGTSDPDASRGRVPDGTPWELARGVAEALQRVTEAAHPGHGLTADAARNLRPAASAYLATVAVPDEHADVSDQVLAPQLAWGTPRHGAAGWVLLQHLAERTSPRLVADLWARSDDSEHVLAAYARLTSSDASALNRHVGQYAMRAAVADVAGTGTPGTLFDGLDPVLVAHRTTPVEADPLDPGHYRVTGSFAPAAYGYTVVRLVPDGSGADVRVRVRGHVDALADAAPGWSFGLVATGPAGPRYSPVTEAVDGELRLSLRPGEGEVYLVVAATPREVTDAGPEAFGAALRYPYEFRVAGALVADPAAEGVVDGGHRHPNGGGWVADTARVDPAAYVATGAVVRGDALVGPGVRLEGRAWVEAGAELTGTVVVRDAAVVRGTARLAGDVLVGGDAVVGFTCASGSYTVYDEDVACGPAPTAPDVNQPVVPFTPQDTALSDAPAATPPPAEATPPSPSPTGGPTGAAPAPGSPTSSAPSAAGTTPPSAVTASPGVAAPPAAVPAGACTASYQVVTSWPGGMQAQITVTATTSGVHGWLLTWTQPPGLEITEQWAVQMTRSGSTVTAENLSWNGSIPDGGNVVFGFNATTASDAALAVPELRCTRTG